VILVITQEHHLKFTIKIFLKVEDIYPIPVKTSQSRVCTKVPTKHVSELKKVIYNWGKTKGLKLPMSDKIIK
jgi:hypothetical protein